MYSRGKSGAVFGTRPLRRGPNAVQPTMMQPNRVTQAAIRTSLPTQFGRSLTTGRKRK